MAGQRVTPVEAPGVDPEAVAVIDRYLADLASTLPGRAPLAADVRAELREDLLEATVSLLRQAPSPADAARAAIAEFGAAEIIAAAFQPELTVRRARQLGMVLFASGPPVGFCWLAAVFLADSAAGTPWRWLPVAVAPLLIIGVPATALAIAITGRLTRWVSPPPAVSSTAAAIAVGTAAGGDLLLLVGSGILLLLIGPVPSLLLGLAIAASAARLVFVIRVGRRLLAPRRSPAALTA